ncbi:MAG: aromatic acid exporter family protein [Mycobacteriales bacterium]
MRRPGAREGCVVRTDEEVPITSDVALRQAQRLARHARTQLAVKSALAAVLAWVVAEIVARAPTGVQLESYLYYAPLGAVVATHPTVAASLRTARAAFLALAVGAGLGVTVHSLIAPGPISLALVVGVGVALGALPGVGEQRSWVPIVALFVLVVGDTQAASYAIAYVALTGLGALCGVALNLLLPALRLDEGEEALSRLRDRVVDQLKDLADGLRVGPAPARQDHWRVHPLGPEASRTREATQEVLDARRGNLRARHHSAAVQRQRRVGRALDRVALLAEDLPEMLAQTHSGDLERKPLDPELAAVTADALDQLAELVRAYDTDLEPDDRRVQDAEEAVRRLTEEFGQRRQLDDAEVAVLGAVVANLRRSLAAVAPERPDRRPSMLLAGDSAQQQDRVRP